MNYRNPRPMGVVMFEGLCLLLDRGIMEKWDNGRECINAFPDISFQYSIIPIYVCEALWVLIKATFFEGGFFTTSIAVPLIK